MTQEWNAEVVEALARAGLRPRAICDVATIRFPGIQRATYRVDLESGEIVKARRLEDEPTARRLAEHRRGLPDAFAPILARHGRVVLEQWVHGRFVGNTPQAAGIVREAAGLLAMLHGMPVFADRDRHDEDTNAWRVKTESWLQALTADGALDAKAADRLRDDLERSDPGRSATGLGHFDFCGENMLLDDSARLRVIDNERVGVGPFGFDLARTRYRWALGEEDWQLFEETYAATVAREAPFSDHEFWRLVVLVQSAHLRLGMVGEHLSVPLDSLRRLAALATAVDTAAP